MKLIRCHIENFGKLSNFDYEFNDSINVIKEDNGFGKTTFADFIKAMFYGMETKRNTKILLDRKKYEPWQGGNFGGSILFYVDEKKYKLERFFGKKETDDIFKLYDLDTNLLSQDYSKNIGEEIFKLNKEAFERSIFISGQNIQTSMNDSINAKLGNILENENDINSSEKAIRIIDEAIKNYKKTGGRGEINEKILEKSKLEQKLENSKINEKNLKERIEKNKKISENLKEKINTQKEYQKQLSTVLKQETEKAIISQYRLLETNYDESKKNLSNFIERKNENTDLNTKIEINKRKKNSIENRISNLLNKIKNKNIFEYTNIIALIVICFTIIILFLLKYSLISIIISFVFIIFIITLIINSILLKKLKNELISKNQELDSINTVQGTLDSLYESQEREQEIEKNRLISDCKKKLELLELYKDENNVQDLLNNYTNRIDIDKEQIEFKLKDINQEINRLNDEKNYNRNQIEFIESTLDSYELENEITELTCQIEEMKENVNILEKTKEFLEVAKNQFSSHYLKKMEESFKQNIESINGNKIDINMDVKLNVQITKKGENKKIEYFSTGYKDLIYICMRISLIEALFENERPVIILDDPFVNLDENKIINAMNLIRKISEKYQVIYFSCHNSRIFI